MKKKTNESKRKSKQIIDKPYLKVSFVFFMLIFLLMVSEGSARLYYSYLDRASSVKPPVSPAVLNPYQAVDPVHPENWILRPGFGIEGEDIKKAKEESGKVLFLQYLNSQNQQGENGVYINSDGFRGPEIDNTHSKLRILTIGDSCTFGLMNDKTTYPRVIEGELVSAGIDAEVINGGVEGYSPYNVLLRIEDFKKLKPDITTIYIGWNGLYGETQYLNSIERKISIIRLINDAYKGFKIKTTSEQEMALAEYKKEKKPDPEALEVQRLKKYVPSMMGDIEKIIKEMQSIGSTVVIITLPGLYVMDEIPSKKSLEIGHLPVFTNNPFVLAIMTERYNMELRNIARRYGLKVVDLDKWSKESLKPRDKYFFDSVHLYEEGQIMIGKYVSNELIDEIKE